LKDVRDWHDISVAFDGATPAWPGDTPVHCGWSWAMGAGASVNVSKWTLSPHVGTHADAPLHVQKDGIGADRLPLLPFIGPAFVVDVRDVHGLIDLDLLRARGVPSGVERLLLRTGRGVGSGAFPAEWPRLATATARELVTHGLRLLGVDAPSVDDRDSKSMEVHHALFDGGAFVLENLDLSSQPAGPCDLLALPIKTGAVDAAPVRALVRNSSARA
jgi:arylformamidase